MKWFAPYLGIVVALLLGVLIVAFSGRLTVQRITPTSTTSPSTTAAVISVGQVASTTVPVVSAPVESPHPKVTPINVSARALREALVNVICYAPAGSGFHSISGSGVVIDPKGIILTNAHIAQYFLLYDRNVSCTIRTGSPAYDRYKASLMYISPAWIQANQNVLTETNPVGTGEHDFALLAVTKSVASVALPSSFPYVLLATVSPKVGASVVIASYGAQSLDPSRIQSALFPTVVFGSVKDVFTFSSTTVDVLALGGSAAAQEGSSGGGVADASGKLVGIITTSTIEGDVSSRSLDALTSSYIRAEYARETGNSLDLLLAQPTATSVGGFASVMPHLESIITVQLPN